MGFPFTRKLFKALPVRGNGMTARCGRDRNSLLILLLRAIINMEYCDEEWGNLDGRNMSEKVKRGILLTAILLIAIGAATGVLYNQSFCREADATGSASKKTQGENIISSWSYTRADVALEEDGDCQEKLVKGDDCQYRVLVNQSSKKTKKSRVLYADKQNADYRSATANLATLLRKEGYSIRVVSCTKSQMLAYVHAKHFDFFLMSQEKEEGEARK